MRRMIGEYDSCHMWTFQKKKCSTFYNGYLSVEKIKSNRWTWIQMMNCVPMNKIGFMQKIENKKLKLALNQKNSKSISYLNKKLQK